MGAALGQKGATLSNRTSPQPAPMGRQVLPTLFHGQKLFLYEKCISSKKFNFVSDEIIL